MYRNRPGCLGGLFELLMLDVVVNWLQRNVGFGRGGCGGCGCGLILLIIFVILFFSIVFNTNWFHALGPLLPMI